MTETEPDSAPGWYIDSSDPAHPFGWNDDGDIFAIYRKGLEWRAVTTSRRLWWERWIKDAIHTAFMLLWIAVWLVVIAAVRDAGHIAWAAILLAGPLFWAWGFVYGKSRP